jgi:hypothetical protein
MFYLCSLVLGLMSHPVTLAWLQARRLRLWVWCESCSHSAQLDVAPILRRVGDRPLPRLRRQLYCSRCGSREIFVRPDWPRRGVVSRAQGLDVAVADVDLTPSPPHGKQKG